MTLKASRDPGVTNPEAPAIRSVARAAFEVVLEYGMVVVLIGLLAVAAITYPGFLATTNLSNIVSQNAPLGLVAIGMTFIIIGGGFDLSVGAIYALSATVFAGTALVHPIPVAAAVALAVSLAAGLANGLLVTRLRVNPFVATLGTATALGGLAIVYSRGAPQLVYDPAFKTLGQGSFLGVPIATIILVAAFIGFGFLLHRTTFGRSVYATGGNWEASRLSGLRVDAIRTATYALTGVLTGFAGMMIASRLSVGQPDIGGLLALDAIAAVVVGGTSLQGGEGAMWRTMVGLAVLAVLTNLFYSLSISLDWQNVIKGVIIVGAVALDAYVRRTR